MGSPFDNIPIVSLIIRMGDATLRHEMGQLEPDAPVNVREHVAAEG